VLAQEIRESSRALGELGVRPPQHFSIGSHVVDGLGVGLDGRGALEEESRRELVQMVRVVDAHGRAADGPKVAQEALQTRRR